MRLHIRRCSCLPPALLGSAAPPGPLDAAALEFFLWREKVLTRPRTCLTGPPVPHLCSRRRQLCQATAPCLSGGPQPCNRPSRPVGGAIFLGANIMNFVLKQVGCAEHHPLARDPRCYSTDSDVAPESHGSGERSAFRGLVYCVGVFFIFYFLFLFYIRRLAPPRHSLQSVPAHHRSNNRPT